MDERRTQWVTQFLVGYSDSMSLKQKIQLLNSYFNQAFIAGQTDEIRRDIERLKEAV